MMSRKGTGKPVQNQTGKGGSGAARAARLKAALKANLGRRKAQARSRAAPLAEPDAEPDGATDTGRIGDGSTGTDGQS